MGFTGIVEEMGTVVSLKKVPDLPQWDGTKGEGVVLTVKCKIALGDAYVGASICINGTCLTVTEYTLDSAGSTAGIFDVNLAPETLRRTNLGDLKEGSMVNLERAMAANGRNSGHNVQGHVDDTGNILDFRRDGESLWVKISASPEVMRYVVPKGYIAVDGTSLTVCEVNRKEGWFNLMLIAHTQTCIVLPTRSLGDRVNLEVDVLAKYLDSAMDGVFERVKTLESSLANAEARIKDLESCQNVIPDVQNQKMQWSDSQAFSQDGLFQSGYFINPGHSRDFRQWALPPTVRIDCSLAQDAWRVRRSTPLLGSPGKLHQSLVQRPVSGRLRSPLLASPKFSAVDAHIDRILYLVPGLFAMVSFLLASICFKKSGKWEKGPRKLQQKLVHT